ncbi:MAG: DUF2088 domain-containing protein, partial [Bacteroidales bacterium]|nr:DUF2088 domain-containing protein [Bacteroidales bacterium]
MVSIIKYGSGEVSFVLPENRVLLSHREPGVTVSPEQFGRVLISRLTGLLAGVKSVGIVVCDKTRLCQYPGYLPVLTKVLLDLEVPRDTITFYIAYGTHARQTEEESLTSYGETYKQFRFVHHNSKAVEEFRDLGTTSRETSVKISEEVLNHDLLISFGAILHHYFAGYGGGRKLLFPGLAAHDSILQNHRLFLDLEKRSIREGCRSGELGHNPLALDLEEIDGLLPRRFEIHALLNSHKQVCELYLGNGYDDFREVCRRYDHYFRSDEEREFDLVVASAGGNPKDINFIQAHKSIHNAASFVKDGGKLVIFAECRDGIGNPAFMNLFKLGGRDNIFEELTVEYKNNAGTALAMLEKSGRIDIHMVTSLSDEECS